ncbi:MAG: hypothetical protein WCK89_13020 [bacterium]
MRKLMVLASAALVGGVAFAEAIPRVYSYQANLKTTVAKNYATVTWTDCNGDKQTEQDICYRVKGTVTVKGVIVLGCDCNDFDGDLDTLEDGYPLVMMATSADKYCQVVFAEEEDTWFGGANRFGSPLSCKATSAELEFDVGFEVGPTNSCTRYFELWNAGFGTASKLEAEEGYDITSISGSTAGWADAPYCSAENNSCPRCLSDGDCEYALAFAPCSGADCCVGPDDDEGLDWGVAYGTFTLKFNKTLSNAIKTIPQSMVQATINTLVPKAFGSCSVPPKYED